MALPVALVLLSALAHAAWNLLASRAGDDTRGFLLAYLLAGAVVVVPGAAVSLALEDDDIGEVVRGAAALGAVSGLLHTAYAVALQVSYRRADVGIVYPVSRGTGPLLAVLAGAWLAAELPTALGWAGIACVLVGVVASSTDGATAAAGGTGGDRSVRAGVLGGLLVGLTIGTYTVWDDYAVGVRGADPVVYYAVTALVQLLVVLAFAGRRRVARARRAFRSAPAAAVGVGVLVPASYLLMLHAMTLAPLAVVAPLRASSVVMGALGAAVLMHEGSPARRVAAAAVVAVGIALIGLGG